MPPRKRDRPDGPMSSRRPGPSGNSPPRVSAPITTTGALRADTPMRRTGFHRHALQNPKRMPFEQCYCCCAAHWRTMASNSHHRGSIEIDLETGRCIVKDDQQRLVDEAVVDIADLRSTYDAGLRKRAWRKRPPHGVRLLVVLQSRRYEFIDVHGTVVEQGLIQADDLWRVYESKALCRIQESEIWQRFRNV